MKKTLLVLVFICVGAFAEKTIDELVEDLKSKTWTVREAATKELSVRGEEAVPALVGALSNGALEARYRAMQALARLYVDGSKATADLVMEKVLELENKEGVEKDFVHRAKTTLVGERQARLIHDFSKFGGNFRKSTAGLTSLTIGPEFTGDADLIEELFEDTLQALIVRDVELTDKFVERVAKLPRLRTVNLFETGVSLESMEELFDNGKALLVCWSGDGLRKTMSRSGTSIGNTITVSKGFEGKLVDLLDENCTSVTIQGLPITEAQVDRIAELKKITSLSLYGTGIIKDLAYAFRSKRSSLRIHWKGGAFFGAKLGYNPFRDPLIREVVAGSPAEKAGFKEGDAILAVDGQRVQSSAFVNIINNRLPGAKLKVGILREKELMNLEVTLGEVTDFSGKQGT